MRTEPCPPLLYRSEAFAEDLDPQPMPLPMQPSARSSGSSRAALWAGLVPAVLALAAGAATWLVQWA